MLRMDLKGTHCLWLKILFQYLKRIKWRWLNADTFCKDMLLVNNQYDTVKRNLQETPVLIIDHEGANQE